jgi:glycosyltransferase involved in cell wall biosynthesis
MKIGIDARLWAQTGVGRYIKNLVINLQKIDSKNEYVIFARSEDLEKVKEYVTGSKWKIVKADIKWHSLKEQFELPGILNKEHLDLVHFPYFSVPVFFNSPFVVTIHDLIMHHFPTGKASTLPAPFYKAKRIGYDKVINHAVRSSKKIIVPLNTVKEDLINSLKIPADKIVVTYEGVDDAISNQASGIKHHDYGKYFLYVGNAYPHKNLDKLIEAFNIFKNGNKNVKLLFVGKDDFFYKRLEKDTKDASIVFLHDVSDKELSVLYKNSIALISASLMEGFGLPAIEAVSRECLVMLSDTPSFKEVLGDGAIYFNPENSEEIAEKMEEVLKNGKKFYSENMLEAKKRLSLFSWEKMARETLKIYESSFSL